MLLATSCPPPPRSDFNECQVHRHYYLALEDKPTSYIAQ
jgi:hypothetical protein